MKKVLVVGENSYIGESFKAHCKDEFKIDTINAKDNMWKTADFTKYDTVFHVAGIAHVSQDKNLDDLYYKVNKDLAIEVAEYAKSNGVKQFVFMSSMIIYGKDGKVGEKKIINTGEEYAPENAYGKSKLEADLAIQNMQTDNFKAVIIRTPVVYGNGCKGNFPRLLNAGKKLIIFPKIRNERSMIYIENLCEFIKLVVQNDSVGVFYPQNTQYVCTSDVVKRTSQLLGKTMWCTRLAWPLISLMSKLSGSVNKVFGNKVYNKTLSNVFNNVYNITDFETSLKECLEI